MYFERIFNLARDVRPGKALVLYGPRQVGKSTLVDRFCEGFSGRVKKDTGEDLRIQELFARQNPDALLEFVEDFQLWVIDEAQHVPGVGLGVKMLLDRRKDISVIVTGSSSFKIAQSAGEPLVGRATVRELFPLSQGELLKAYNRAQLKAALPSRLVYGSYPEVLLARSDAARRAYLENFVNALLLKDILSLENLRSPQLLVKLLKLLAFQVGQLVSYGELATQLGVNQRTVERYCDLLEKSFVVIRVTGFSRNLRKEVSKKAKYYFVDNGIRNAIVSQFNVLTSRTDVGQLWENFVFVERLKKRTYGDIFGAAHFWRTHDGQEVDLVEDRDGAAFGYEFKWNPLAKAAAPRDWPKAATKTTWEVVHPGNYLDFVV